MAQPTATRQADPGLFDILGNFGNQIASVFNDPVKAVTGPTMPVKKSYKQSQMYLDQYIGKNVLVTGATGDIGSKICRKLYKAGVTHLCMFVRTEETFNAKSKKALFSNQSVTQTHIEEIDFREP